MTRLAAVPPRPARDTRMDIVRGWLQLTIFASHVAGSWIGAWLIFGAWGLSDSSEQFVLLSGFNLGSLFARNAIRSGWRSASLDMLRRTSRLYRAQLVMLGLFAMLAILAGGTLLPHEAERLGWGFLLQRPLEAVPAALSLVYQPAYMDILPVFIWCMLILPAFALLEARAGAWALLAPVAIYAAAWLVPPLLQPLPFPGPGSGFNPIAWQVLFLGGAWLGRRSLLTGQALPRHAWLTALSVVIVLAGFWLRLAWFGFLGWHAPVAESALMIGKENLALPRILHALALAWLVARFVPRDAAWMHGAFARGLATAGRYSLQVFCLGVFLSWGVMAAFRLFPGCVWWLNPLLIVSGGMALLLFARMLEQQRRAPRVAVPVSP